MQLSVLSAYSVTSVTHRQIKREVPILGRRRGSNIKLEVGVMRDVLRPMLTFFELADPGKPRLLGPAILSFYRNSTTR